MIEIRDWTAVISLLLTAGTFVYAWLTRSGKEAGERVSALETRHGNKIEVLEDKIARLEGELRVMPDRESVHRMELEMVAMRGSIETLTERLKPLSAISDRLQDFLIQQAKGH